MGALGIITENAHARNSYPPNRKLLHWLHWKFFHRQLIYAGFLILFD